MLYLELKSVSMWQSISTTLILAAAYLAHLVLTTKFTSGFIKKAPSNRALSTQHVTCVGSTHNVKSPVHPPLHRRVCLTMHVIWETWSQSSALSGARCHLYMVQTFIQVPPSMWKPSAFPKQHHAMQPLSKMLYMRSALGAGLGRFARVHCAASYACHGFNQLRGWAWPR